MVIPIVVSILFWLPVTVLIVRILAKSGMVVPENKFFGFICADKSGRTVDTGFAETGVKEAAAVFGLCVLFRILVYAAGVAAIGFFTESDKITFQSVLDQWRQWDALHYKRIATGGYTYYIEDGRYVTLVFFPLCAVAIKLVYLVVRNMELAGMIASTLCYSGGCVYLYKLVKADYGKECAQGAVMLISVFPYSVFFGAGMSEGIFFMMSAAALYYLRRENFMMFAVFGILTALSRMVGLMIICPAIIEIFERYEIIAKIRRKEKIGGILLKTLPLAVTPAIGTLIYLYVNYSVTGDAFKFLEYQQAVWYQGFEYFGKSVKLIFEKAWNEKSLVPLFGIWIPETITVTAVIAALIYGVRRHRSMYIVFFAVCAFVNMSLKWPISVTRYTSTLIPFFIVAADFLERHKQIKPFVWVVSALFMGVYLTGFLFSKQIL